jgi:uncharacterized protein (TIGR03000 family)
VLLLPQAGEAQVRFGVGIGGGRGGVRIGNAPYYGYGYGRGYYYNPYRYGSWGYPGYYGYRYSYPGYYSYSYPRYYSGYSYYPGTSYYYSQPYYSYSTPSYSYSTPQYYSYGGTTQPYQSLYPPSGSSESAQTEDRAVHVRVRVPDPNAEVLFGGQKTQQTGTTRAFVSPQLSGDGQYTYRITARWQENGQTVERARNVNVRPGQYVDVDFTRDE